MIFQFGFQPSQSSSGGGALYEVIRSWQEIGVYDVILPFLLVFTLAFAILEKSKIFGSEKRNINLIVGLILGLLFLQNNYLVYMVQRFLPNVSMMLIVFLMFLLILALFGGENAAWSGGALTLGFIVSVVTIILSLSTDWLPFGEWGLLDYYNSLDPGTRGFIWLIILILVVVGFVTHEKKGGNDSGGFWNALKDIAEGTKKGSGNKGG